MTPRPSVVLDVCVGALFHTVLLFSIFLLFAGHNAPGGGFVGGLVAGAALVLRYVQRGQEAVRAAMPVSPQVLLGMGLALALAVATGPLVVGGTFFESFTVSRQLPLAGTVKATSTLLFDVGVYVVVVGLVLAAVRELGEEDPA